MSLYAIILAAGSGSRIKNKTPKSFLKVGGKEIYKYSLKTFISTKKFKKIILVVPPKYQRKISGVKVVIGAKTRNESFEKAMSYLKGLKANDKIFVHDAARIFVLKKDIVKMCLVKTEQGTLCYKNVKSVLGRSDLKYKEYNIQTPQFCIYHLYQKAHKNPSGKDLFTYLNLKHKKNDFIISSNKHLNFKITYPDDLKVAELLIK